jgi:hypothetical protein
VQWISALLRAVGHEGATANARAVLEQRRWELEQVAALARRVERADAARAASVGATTATERVA